MSYPRNAMSFAAKLHEAARLNETWLCVGLDPDPTRLPTRLRDVDDPCSAIVEFHRSIVAATRDLVCAYKANSAFYEALGPIGLETLQQTCAMVPDDIPVVLDAKRGDVGHTSQKYAEFAFEQMGADAVTLSPYLGVDALAPFLAYGERGVFLLCRTSNPSSSDLQDLQCGGKPLYQHVAESALDWQRTSDATLGLVAGATSPEQLGLIRDVVGEATVLLVPGVGAQQGDLGAAVRAGVNRDGRNAIVNASRGVLYASDGPDFADAARASAERLRQGINDQGGRP
ncbi:MAG: orotidine-5'-phosphate decarboxylase [Candidatus Bipolaricaulia bacterium]